jgi:hypothetical protein
MPPPPVTLKPKIQVWHVLYCWLQHKQISNQSRFRWGLEVIEQIYCTVGWNLLLHLVKLQGDFHFSFGTSTKRSEQPQGDFFARIALQREPCPIHVYKLNASNLVPLSLVCEIQVYIIIVVFQTAIVKGRNRNSYEYKNCTTDPNSGK